MNLAELLPITTRFYKGETTQHIQARKLHAFLEVGKDFSNWIKDRIAEYGFTENEDFCSPILASKENDCSPKSGSKKGRGGHNKKDYLLTLDMAKELAMVERNQQGRLARKYFIACESQLKAVAPEIHQQEIARWVESREMTKSPYKAMCNALQRARTRQGKTTQQRHYINESNMLMSLVLGMSVQHWKTTHEIQGEARENLNAQQLEQLAYLERADEILLDGDMADFEQRKLKLNTMLAQRFNTFSQLNFKAA